jgi:RNA-directed DNA polymerase
MSKLLTKLGATLFLSEPELMWLIRSAPRRYKVYQIPKRKPGQFRTIAQPAREVKALQYWVMKNVLKALPIHPTATAYREGKNIADNAHPHRNGTFLLKLDFTDFFPSIKARDFERYMKKKLIDFESGDIEALSRILFWKPKGTRKFCLSIGAPSSPLVSNILLFEFDERVAKYCAKHGIMYTRYADDISLSADVSSKLREVEQFIVKLCAQIRSPKVTLNSEKLVRVSKKQARRITGLVISNDAKVSLGHDKKRQIRASVHHFLTGRLNKEESLKLRGMLAYVKSVEPSFLTRLRKKYGLEAIRRIQTFAP